MLVEHAELERQLGGTVVEVEPLGLRAGASERLTLDHKGGAHSFMLVRRFAGAEARENHIAVLEALQRARFAGAPRLLAVVGETTIEEWVDGLTALNVEPSADRLEAAVDTLAELHRLPIREGLRWERSPDATMPGRDLQLFRLGFTSEERAAAEPTLAEARAALASGSLGFCHAAATADHVVFGPSGPRLVNFGAAGFGPQLCDIAAFLLTCGAEATLRDDLARRYAAGRLLPTGETAGMIELAGMLWGLDWLLGLPRRLIENFGDDVASAAIRLTASRIEDGIRSPAAHPVAIRTRAALWG